MNKLVYSLILILILCGCATNSHFVTYRNNDVGRSVDLNYTTPSKIIPFSQTQDKYLYEWDNGCKFVYYVDKETKIVKSWEYISSPDKCSLGYDWFGPW